MISAMIAILVILAVGSGVTAFANTGGDVAIAKAGEMVEGDEDGREYEAALLKAIGMTADEYWNEYKVKKESPAHLMNIKIAEYLEANNLEEMPYKEIIKSIDAKITDKELLKRWGKL